MANQNVKIQILRTLKSQWKNAVSAQYLTNPKAVRDADIHKNAKDIMNGVMKNPMGRTALKSGGITLQDIEKVLSEIQSEVIAGE